ncbi:MAG: 4Fe-4S cluster-binding domain-containing protein [Promethearchaeota archaeon]|nr:MAG: 4Fe-4S cluster-binding domain-containing protein [Candidatus Lokiarchaeota archaeon]
MKRTNKIIESKGNTFYVKGRNLPKGCSLCLKGSKAVLFLNGICQNPEHCSWYCPISEERKNKDLTFADEIQVSSNSELLIELDTINAKGMSITGGDPLIASNLAKTVDYIKYVKSVKGKKFHVHLYTNGIDFNDSVAEKLRIAGLDEIRFHPPKDKWKNIKYALNKGISVGAEVPVIPTDEEIRSLEKFILYLDKIGADFINLNEFEICYPNSQFLKEKGFRLKKGTIASVENSKEMALFLINKLAPKTSLKIHFCTIRAKDYYQLRNRYLRRAKSIKLLYEQITEEGLLIYAIIDGKEENIDQLKLKLQSTFKISESLISIEKNQIKLPYRFSLRDDFIKFLDENKIQGFIEEIIPFRGKYCQITERTPIKVFKQEIMGF